MRYGRRRQSRRPSPDKAAEGPTPRRRPKLVSPRFQRFGNRCEQPDLDAADRADRARLEPSSWSWTRPSRLFGGQAFFTRRRGRCFRALRGHRARRRTAGRKSCTSHRRVRLLFLKRARAARRGRETFSTVRGARQGERCISTRCFATASSAVTTKYLRTCARIRVRLSAPELGRGSAEHLATQVQALQSYYDNSG